MNVVRLALGEVASHDLQLSSERNRTHSGTEPKRELAKEEAQQSLNHCGPSFSSMKWVAARTRAVGGESELSEYKEQEDEYLELIKIDSMAKVLKEIMLLDYCCFMCIW